MPYRIIKQDCRQSDDKKGTYVLQKKEKGKWHKVSCHTSEEKAKSSMRARGINEKYGRDNYKIMKLSKRQLRRIIKEEKAKLQEMGSGPEGAYQDAVSASREAYYELQEIMDEWENTPEMNSQGPGGGADFKNRIYAVMDNILNKEESIA
jgi:hypothetical protein